MVSTMSVLAGPLLSPLGLLEEHYRHDAWRLLVVCMLTNQTRGSCVHAAAERLFARYPSPRELAAARRADVADIVGKLGFQHKRPGMLIRFSRACVRTCVAHACAP